jgi:hypothetical protein
MENVQRNEAPLPEGLLGKAAEEILEAEIDILEYLEQGKEIPHGRHYRTKVDCEVVRVDTLTPTGETLLRKVGKRHCAYELIAEFHHCENQVVEPDETIDLRTHGLKGFITAHREIVKVFFGKDGYSIERGKRSVAEILKLVGKTPDTYMLLEEKCRQPPMVIPPNQLVEICGCEEFHAQVQTGGSS